MKRLFPILIACLLPFIAQAQENRLGPIMVYNISSPDIYHTIVLDTLIPEKVSVTFAYVVRPSFDPEYALVYNWYKKKFIYASARVIFLIFVIIVCIIQKKVVPLQQN